MSADDLLARLGPQTFNIPDGARRDVSAPKEISKTLRKVRRALELSSVGVESSTRSHGTETRSYDLSAMSPQDIAAAVGFIRDPLSRELFCLARWPGYADRMPESEQDAFYMMVRRILDERSARASMREPEWIQRPIGADPANKRGRMHREHGAWPELCDTYKVLAMIAMNCLDGGGMPTGEKIAKACGIDPANYSRNWRHVMAWIESDVARMQGDAEHQFMNALR